MGHLVAYLDYDKIAELKINALVRSESDVLAEGPVREKLGPGIKGHLADVRSALPKTMRTEFSDWVDGLTDDWISSICRLLLRVRNYRHGGALLITPDASLRGLNVKYKIKYSRLRTGLVNRAVFRIQEMFASDLIFGGYITQDADDIPIGLYFDETINTDEFEDSRSELEGAIWFVSLLTRVDGLVLMKPGLDVDGFGVEITYQKRPTTVFRTRDRLARKTKLHRVNYEQFGTRHRSIMRYCNETPGAVGFVI
jgi:hypothetical protein